jgi:hypothetical protein
VGTVALALRKAQPNSHRAGSFRSHSQFVFCGNPQALVYDFQGNEIYHQDTGQLTKLLGKLGNRTEDRQEQKEDGHSEPK